MTGLVPYAGQEVRGLVKLDAYAGVRAAPLNEQIAKLWRTGEHDTLTIAAALGITEARAYAGLSRRSGQVTR